MFVEYSLLEFQINLEIEAGGQIQIFLSMDLLIAPKRQPLGALKILSIRGVLTAGWSS